MGELEINKELEKLQLLLQKGTGDTGDGLYPRRAECLISQSHSALMWRWADLIPRYLVITEYRETPQVLRCTVSTNANIYPDDVEGADDTTHPIQEWEEGLREQERTFGQVYLPYPSSWEVSFLPEELTKVLGWVLERIYADLNWHPPFGFEVCAPSSSVITFMQYCWTVNAYDACIEQHKMFPKCYPRFTAPPLSELPDTPYCITCPYFVLEEDNECWYAPPTTGKDRPQVSGLDFCSKHPLMGEWIKSQIKEELLCLGTKSEVGEEEDGNNFRTMRFKLLTNKK